MLGMIMVNITVIVMGIAKSVSLMIRLKEEVNMFYLLLLPLQPFLEVEYLKWCILRLLLLTSIMRHSVAMGV